MSTETTEQGIRRWPEHVRTPERGKALREGLRAVRDAFDAIEAEETDPFIAAEVGGMTVVFALGWRGEVIQDCVRRMGGVIERKQFPR